MKCNKKCVDCYVFFKGNSGSQKYCQECINIKLICLECGKQNKDIYHTFCSNSCAGKWKFRNSKKVRSALDFGRYDEQTRIKKGKSNSISQSGIPKLKNRRIGSIGKNNRDLLRGRIEYVNWRTAIYMRDNYTCQFCNQRRKKLQADHIKPQFWYPELALDITNGRTLCIKCHKNTDTYGHKVKTIYKEKNKEQLILDGKLINENRHK